MNQIRLVQYDSSSSSESEEETSSYSSTSSSSCSTPASADESDDDDDQAETTTKKKTEKNQQKGELDSLPPIEQLNLSVEEVLCEPLGKVGWTVDQLVIVLPNPGKPTLDLDTILFLDRGKRVLGRIFDVFGKVTEPHYCVRFNTPDHIKENNIQSNMMVYFVPNSEHTSLVFESELRKVKAVDEIDPEEEPYFSNDEAEEAYRRSKLKRKADVPAKRSRQSDWQSDHPWSSHNSYLRTRDKQRRLLLQKRQAQANWLYPVYNDLLQGNQYPQYPCQDPREQQAQTPRFPPQIQTFPWVNNQAQSSVASVGSWSTSIPPMQARKPITSSIIPTTTEVTLPAMAAPIITPSSSTTEITPPATSTIILSSTTATPLSFSS